MPKIVIKIEGRILRDFELKQGLNLLGRTMECDCCLDHPSISGCHCELLLENGSILVRDLGSTNGTYLDGRRIQESVFLNGQTLRIGAFEIGLDGPPVNIAVNPLPLPEQEPVATVMPDGKPCCLNHPGVEAALVCQQCDRYYCQRCVRYLRLVGKPVRTFCPACSGVCIPYAPPAVVPRQNNVFVKAAISGFKKILELFTRPPRPLRRKK